MQRILLAAFLRGIGGGLALAATPYILAAGHGACAARPGGRARARLGRGCRRLLPLLRRARGHRKMQRKQPADDVATRTRRLRRRVTAGAMMPQHNRGRPT